MIIGQLRRGALPPVPQGPDLLCEGAGFGTLRVVSVSIPMSIGQASTGPYEAGCRACATPMTRREGYVAGLVWSARRDS